MRRQRVLITGISRFWGYELAQRLEADPMVEQIVGIDVREPAHDLARTDFIRADLRHSLVGKLVRALGIDTVVHTNLIVDPRRTSARVAHETNVIGSMNLLAACSGVESPVRKLLVKSSTAIYGSEPDDPSVWTEDMTRRTPPQDAFSRDIVEVESYVRDFALRQPGATVTVLRFTNVLGPLLQTPFQAYFGLPAVPTVLGFDPRLQFLHEDDAVEALYRATVENHPGAYNVSGPGVVILSQAARILGRRCLPVIPPVGGNLAALALKRVGLLDWPPHLVRLIQYGRVVDVARLRERFGWEPRRSSCEVLHDYARGLRVDGAAAVVSDGESEVPGLGRPRLLEGVRRG
ncbi:MAG: NAD-dependent epimerase/dehydratase [Chloroflexi bacterium]|jgi:UDP-glucose 4-epimerase|nr:NAD-dependent epimerase/dehydratase [Chloroflexota bacterium]MEA2618058.1 UDP-glucose 4-epimerase [Chloroflexota bacterium]